METTSLQPARQPAKPLDWDAIDVVFLDMDGTLIDLHFDNMLWNTHLPERFAAARGLSATVANDQLSAHMRRHAHTINFYCVDYWAEFTELDIMSLHGDLGSLLRYRPGTQAFLHWLSTQPQRVILTTNAHRKSIDFKHGHIGLLEYFDTVVSSHDYQQVKESQAFWQQLQHDHGFDANRALFIDDHEPVLNAAASFGIGHLRNVATPDLQRPTRTSSPYALVDDLSELISP